MDAHKLDSAAMLERFHPLNVARMNLWRQAYRERDQKLKESGLYERYDYLDKVK